MNNRREFIRQATVVAASLMAAPEAVALLPQSMGLHPARLSEPPQYSTFSNLLGSTFWVRHDHGQGQWLELTETTLHSAQPFLETFSVFFEGPANAALSQGTYIFQHRKLGICPLFIVPQPSDNGRCVYQAVFNRLAADQRTTG